MDRLKQIVALLLLGASIHILITSFLLSKEHQALKYELAVINDARYGLFNLSTWRQELKAVLVKQVAEFELEGQNREAVKAQLENMLLVLITEVEESVNELDGFFSRVKGKLANVILNFDKLREQVPDYAEAIMKDLEDPENMEALRASVLVNIDEWIVTSVSDSLSAPPVEIMKAYGCKDRIACNEQLKAEIDFIHERLWLYTAIALIFAIVVWLILLISDTGKLQLYLLGISSAILLAGGLLLPMLDLQAGMDDIAFTIMGETIHFRNQVLFFQSKSILDVIHTLFRAATFNSLLVGFLILLFSVLFPLSKLIASLVYIHTPQRQHGKFMEFLVFRSGKWSMADVFVVAVFMAFLGFSGLIDSQLANLPQSESFHSVSFNASVFQTGFAWFIGFCITGLFLSVAIAKGLHGRRKGAEALTSGGEQQV